MSLIDYIKQILNNNKRNAQIYCQTLSKTYMTKDQLEIGLYDGKQPIIDTTINITINGKTYQRKTDKDGIARLNINLPPNTYTATIDFENDIYNRVTTYCDVIIKSDTRMEGINLTKNEGDSTPYQCAVYDMNNNRIKDEVTITINGVSYTRKAKDDGLYKLNINLNKGTYSLKAEFKGNTFFNPSSIENTITINKPSGDKKTIVLGCDANTSDDSYVQNRIAERLQAEGYPVEKLAIEPNAFASYDWSEKSKGKIGIYLIASGLFSIADAWENQNGFDNYVFGIRGDFGDKGATCFDCPISADADCTSICDKFDGKTFNEINRMVQPKIAICGGSNTDELADNIIDWLNGLEHKEERPPEQEKSRSEKVLDYFEDHFGECQYIDDALEAIQGKGYSFYFSDGYNMYETIERVANGDGANCFDIAEVLYHCAKGMNSKYGRNYEVQYLDVWCPVSGYDHIRLRLKSNGSDWFYRDGACILDGGDITDNWCGTSDNILEINPSFIYDGD